MFDNHPILFKIYERVLWTVVSLGMLWFVVSTISLYV